MCKIEAYKLRDKATLATVPNNKPGYYKWWAKREEIQTILDKLEVSFEEVEPYLEVNGDRYCIYVGIAAKESIRKRLNWHINQINTRSNVTYGTLSTLRQSISSIVGENMLSTSDTNDFIDKLIVEYHPVDLPIKSQEAIDYIGKIEEDMLSGKYLYILNIKENRHSLAPTRKLSSLRQVARKIDKEKDEEDEKI